MKWQQRVQVTTGLSCWQIMLHLLVVCALLVGWKTATLIHVGIGLCLVYVATVVVMFALQPFRSGRLRDIADFLEELTTTWYFGSAMIAGPIIYSLLVKDKASSDFATKHPIRR